MTKQPLPLIDLAEAWDKHQDWDAVLHELGHDRVHDLISDFLRQPSSAMELVNTIGEVVELFTDEQIAHVEDHLLTKDDDVRELVELALYIGVERGIRGMLNDPDYREFIRSRAAQQLGVERANIPDSYLDVAANPFGRDGRNR